MTVIRWLITLPVLIGTIAFCVANTRDIAVTFSPLHAAVEVPLYAIGLGALSLGFIWGLLVTGIQTIQLRLQARRQRKHIQQLEKKLAASTSATSASNATNTSVASREPDQQYIEKLPGT